MKSLPTWVLVSYETQENINNKYLEGKTYRKIDGSSINYLKNSQVWGFDLFWIASEEKSREKSQILV